MLIYFFKETIEISKIISHNRTPGQIQWFHNLLLELISFFLLNIISLNVHNSPVALKAQK